MQTLELNEFHCQVLLLILAFQELRANCSAIQIDTQRDYEVLDHFFRMGILEEGYGYVLEGEKPISVRNFYSLDNLPLARDQKITEREFLNTLLVREAIPIWKKLCSSQKNFALKAVSLNDRETEALGWEIQFIHIPKLQEVIDKNIDLFRYVLGPTLKSEQLVHKIAYSEELLSDILHDDSVLIGIVLGFGSYNSLLGGREDTISSLTISRDLAPFSPKSLLIQSNTEHSLNFLTPEAFGVYYLEVAGGDDSSANFRCDFSYLKPSSAFLNVTEEIMAIHADYEPLPTCLSTQQPAFIFSPYKGGSSNQPFFESLIQRQKQSQALLKKADFLEQVLKKIGGKKPRITCDKPKNSNLSLSFFQGTISTQIWEHILHREMHRLTGKQKQSIFLEAFFNPPDSALLPPAMVGVSQASLDGLIKALQNLSNANAYFENLSQVDSLQVIVPKQLYCKTTLKGTGKELREFDHVRLSYVIEDLEGNILFANHNTWLNLSETLSSFAHGMQGMCIGEKRQLFIHPAIGYGALTTLPPCIGLVVKVQLFDIDKKSFKPLNPLTAVDLRWIQNPILYRNIKESLDQQPRFMGMFYRNMLDQIEGSNKAKILPLLKTSLNFQQVLDQRQHQHKDNI